MRIINLMKSKKPFVSLEFFPPKEQTLWPKFFQTVEKLKIVNPLFVSVTCGALGSSQEYTKEITIRLKQEFKLEPMAHLTCIGASADKLHFLLKTLLKAGVDNVLALRGDFPQDEVFNYEKSEFKHASDLVTFLHKHYPQLGIAVAGYPESHPESPSLKQDLKFLKFKLDKGADFVITQLFFDNSIYWNFIKRAKALGIDKPIIPGILPVTSLTGLKRILSQCGASIPEEFLKDLYTANKKGTEAVQALGTEYAIMQIKELLNRAVPGIHIYTLNRTKVCLNIFKAIGLI
ncbi:MAG: methylenetetrahydrofolate reductase [NAD(P)H] [Deltaproteobacteria bacterium]|nr:methylenetetrahydrofolate reductase [NAD(P)H] [Deltaproteobacteria bacterium]